MRLHIFAVQPHYFGQIRGVEQRLRIVQRCLHVLFGIGNRLGADVLGAGANRRAPLLDRARGLLRAGEEFLKGLARLIEAGFRHRSHFIWNLETLTLWFAHDPTPVVRQSNWLRQIIGKTLRRYDAAPVGSHRAPLIAICNIPNAGAAAKLQVNLRGSTELTSSRLWIAP